MNELERKRNERVRVTFECRRNRAATQSADERGGRSFVMKARGELRDELRHNRVVEHWRSERCPLQELAVGPRITVRPIEEILL